MRAIKSLFKRYHFLSVCIGIVPLLFLRAGVVQAAPLAHSKVWNIVPSPVTDGELFAVSASSTNDMWAVGNDYSGSDHPLTEYWNGTQWSIVPNPMGNKIAGLNGVVDLSPGDAWAVGGASDTGPLIEHWDGTQWSIVPSPNPGNLRSLAGIAAVSPNDIWAVGQAGGYPHYITLTEHWDGTQWSIIPSPTPGQSGYLTAIAAVASNDVWAVGNSDGAALIEHGDGTQWSIVSTPNAPSLTALTVAAANDIWAVGGSILHWDGSSWSVVPNHTSPGVLNGVAAISATDVWAVGTINHHHYKIIDYKTLIEHWNGSTWSVVKGPDTGTGGGAGLQGITAIGSSLWSVGFYNFVEHHHPRYGSWNPLTESYS